jgi:hypothetical protein
LRRSIAISLNVASSTGKASPATSSTTAPEPLASSSSGWDKVTAAIERKAASERAPARAEFPDYVRALQRIALGHDATATASDQLAAVKELLKLDAKGTTSYLERPAQSELTEREHAIREAVQRRSLAKREREYGID